MSGSRFPGGDVPTPGVLGVPKQLSSPASAQIPATAESTHQMLVAIAILLAGGMLLVLIAGESEEAGNVVIAGLGIITIVQATTHVSPFIAWINKHPLIPQT